MKDEHRHLLPLKKTPSRCSYKALPLLVTGPNKTKTASNNNISKREEAESNNNNNNNNGVPLTTAGGFRNQGLGDGRGPGSSNARGGGRGGGGESGRGGSRGQPRMVLIEELPEVSAEDRRARLRRVMAECARGGACPVVIVWSQVRGVFFFYYFYFIF